ncbi:response regulator [Echinicola sp. CAU 1574]|uniref:histidine kinase n=1 Tax=Echinicola arenosa TaxID=2774144 RepID=A0ABR9AEY3_9BACT|nr:two-component regulator propeller domain-containing protein [Echinicola arenosa]MBD8487364.1 response regulator [Echinicola arenosa]
MLYRPCISIFLLILTCTALFGQGTGHPFYKFTHFTSQDGLPQNSILAILQDDMGYLWFGTDDGLARFDGYQFTVYKHQFQNPNSLNNNVIRGLAQDKNGYIWISTEGGGINIYDPKTASFCSIRNSELINSKKTGSLLIDHQGNIWVSTLTDGIYKVNLPPSSEIHHLDKLVDQLKVTHYTKDNSRLADDNIWQLFQDSSQQIWIGTYDHGAQLIDPITGTFSSIDIYHHGKKVKSVKGFFEDNEKNLWIGTENHGVFIKAPESKSFKPFRTSSGLEEENITSFLQDKQGNIWIGTLGGGLFVYETNSSTVYHYDDNPSDSYSLNGKSVYTMLEDENGNLWIGMYSGEGLNKINPSSQHFEHYRPQVNDRGSLSGKMVKSIFIDHQANLWVGMFNGGLNVKMDGANNFREVPLNSNSGQGSTNVQVIFEDSHRKLWIGTDGSGLYQYSPSLNKMKAYHHDVHDSTSLSKDEIWAIAEDGNGSLWIGMANGGGLNRFDPSTNQFQPFYHRPNNPRTPSFNDVRTLLVDSKNRLWIGTYGGGLNRYDFDTDTFVYYKHDPSNNQSISHDIITSLHEDQHGAIWVGTFGGGLNQLDPATQNFNHFRENDGLPSDVIKAVLEDDSGQLWISTVKGLSSFNPEMGTFKNYTAEDGLQSNEFNLGSAFKSIDGKMYFGGTNGFNAFLPEQIGLPQSPKKPVLTKLRVLNRVVHPGDTVEQNVLLTNSISYTDELTLYDDHNSFELEFSAMEFNQQEKIGYAYMLEGFDKDWVYTDASRRYAAYSNLLPGEYIFKVKSTSENGLQSSEERTLQLSVLPPWYKSTIAFWVYIILFLLIAYFVKSIIGFRIKMKNDLRFERLENQKQEEINQLKLRFFTNISHELRTPLMLIKLPLEQLIRQKDLSYQIHQQLNSIHNNASRLLRLINQLLEFRKQETGHLKLEVQEYNPLSFFKSVFASFEALAKQRNIDFKLILEDHLPKKIWFDLDQMEKVAYNICYNAFKFTPNGGKISVQVKNRTLTEGNTNIEGIEIIVEDNGKGIPLKYQDRIFERFFQIEDPHRNITAGTGIGLSLSKNIVEFHHGKISMSSIPDVHTAFSIFLRNGKEHFQPHEIRSIPITGKSERPTLEEELSTLDLHMLSSINPKNDNTSVDAALKNKKLLLVEDNEELLYLMKSALKDHFQILTASNGKEGLHVATSRFPDIIISDVMMPEMDGVELCSLLKKEIKTSHIPVLLLTARSNHDYQLEGYSSGADDYLSKPFPLDLMIAKIRNLLHTREKFKEAFKLKPEIMPSDISISPADTELLEKAIQIAEKHMDNPDFDITMFVREMGMSRTILFDKLKATTDHTPNEFIQTLRLKRAAQLLLQSDHKISEISYMVGFNNPKYFSKCFQKHFGCSPRQYSKNKFGS